MARTRNMLAERWPSRYFTAYRPEENDAPITQADVVKVLDGIDDVDRPLIIDNIAEDYNLDRIAGEFYCDDEMAAALIEYVRGGGR